VYPEPSCLPARQSTAQKTAAVAPAEARKTASDPRHL